MKKNIIYIVVTLVLSANIFAGIDENKNYFQIGFTFGEIPILSGSFKPGITFGYNLNEHIGFEITYQLKDYLQRDEESFNAENIGFDGLQSSKETTGERMFIGVKYKPTDWSPYLTIGFVYNNIDIEKMKFDKHKRIIGNNTYNTAINIEQKRESGFKPAIGFGYQYDFENNISINTSFAMAFFSKIVDPEVKIESEKDINESDKKTLKENINKSYKDNFHNRYHIFNLGIIYKFN